LLDEIILLAFLMSLFSLSFFLLAFSCGPMLSEREREASGARKAARKQSNNNAHKQRESSESERWDRIAVSNTPFANAAKPKQNAPALILRASTDRVVCYTS